MSEIEEKIMNKLNEVLDNDISAINVRISRKDNNKNISIVIESESGISHDDCVKTSRTTQNLITLHKIIDNDYNIEVSSPGINRSLYCLNDFIKYQGEKIYVELKKNIKNQKRFKGIYKMNKNMIQIQNKKETTEIPYDSIKRANLIREIKI